MDDTCFTKLWTLYLDKSWPTKEKLPYTLSKTTCMFVGYRIIHMCFLYTIMAVCPVSTYQECPSRRQRNPPHCRPSWRSQWRRCMSSGPAVLPPAGVSWSRLQVWGWRLLAHLHKVNTGIVVLHTGRGTTWTSSTLDYTKNLTKEVLH